ncbi:MAG: DDE-type integrase/transposase/recombinase [Thermoplasmata archaeon]
MGALQRVVDWIEGHEVFERERMPNEVRALGMLLYRSGLGCGMAGRIVGVSHTAVWDWVHRGRALFADQKRRVCRRRLAIDEKEVKVGETPYYVWAAVDLDREEVVEVLVTQGRSGLEATAFLRRVARLCRGRKPRVFVDGGSWYPWALQRLGFRWTVVAFGPRSMIERFFSQVEWRLVRFWGRFYRGDRESLQSWMEAFAGLTNSEELLS